MTQVPWAGDTARAPAMCGTDTLAMVVSSTTMKLASASSTAAVISRVPCSGSGTARARPDIAFASAADVDVGGHRHADPQGVLLQLLGIEGDAHRHALDHLDPVAGGFLRRDQGERRA